MIKNYLLLALKVLRRKPFYTFVSLFGISFTLMILMLITSMGDAVFGANPPMSEVDRMVFVSQAQRTRLTYDTTYIVDSVLMRDGTMRYDSTLDIQDAGKNNNSGWMSLHFLENTLLTMDHVTTYSFYSKSGSIDAYLDGRKVNMDTYYTDAGYWEVFDFRFIQGEPFNTSDIRQANKKVILTEKIAGEYFGTSSENLLGREMELGRERYVVTGIVARPRKDGDEVAGDVFLPYTTMDGRELSKTTVNGAFQAVFLASAPRYQQSIINQINFIAEKYDMSGDDEFDNLELRPGSATDVLARNLTGAENDKTAKLVLFTPLIILLTLFLALPLINLINLGVSRIYERRSEIAVRKSFGADSRDILYQFLFENILITVIGGVLGLVLAIIFIRYINANDLLGSVRLSYSLKFFGYFVVVIVLFALLSGLWPALRMSRTPIADALR